MSAEQYSVDPQDLFYKAIKALFGSWTALQIAISNDLGGSNTKEAADWFHTATHQYVSENNDLEDFELEEFFEDTMNNEFNIILDDDSASNIAKNVLKYFHMYKCGQNLELMNCINGLELKFKNKSTVSSSIKQSNDDDTSSDEEDEQEMEKVETNEPKKNALTAEESEQIEKMEDGWTWVGRSGKHFTKNNNQTNSDEQMDF